MKQSGSTLQDWHTECATPVVIPPKQAHSENFNLTVSVVFQPQLKNLITNALAMKFVLTENDLNFHSSRLLWCHQATFFKCSTRWYISAIYASIFKSLMHNISTFNRKTVSQFLVAKVNRKNKITSVVNYLFSERTMILTKNST